MKFESRQYFEKYPNIKFHKNSSSGSRVVPCRQKKGWTDMNEANSRFLNILRMGFTNENVRNKWSSQQMKFCTHSCSLR